MSELIMHPFQSSGNRGRGGKITSAVTLRAYEVYCRVYGAQEALITDGCRGGFSEGELIAFLYAYPFPESEWRQRVNEALDGMRFL